MPPTRIELTPFCYLIFLPQKTKRAWAPDSSDATGFSVVGIATGFAVGIATGFVVESSKGVAGVGAVATGISVAGAVVASGVGASGLTSDSVVGFGVGVGVSSGDDPSWYKEQWKTDTGRKRKCEHTTVR